MPTATGKYLHYLPRVCRHDVRMHVPLIDWLYESISRSQSTCGQPPRCHLSAADMRTGVNY